jgi:hypothetical protein
MFFRSDQTGFVKILPLLFIIAVVGILSFLFISSTAPLEKSFSRLFPKPAAKADSSFLIGVNISGISDYGYPNPFPFSSSQDIDKNLQEINRIGGKVIRIFVANENVSDAEAAQRLSLLLDKAQPYNISVIVSFIDFYGTPFRPQGTSQYYTDSFNGTPILGRAFFENGYQGRYKDFVTTVIQTNKQHSNVFAWEMGNELKYDTDPIILRNFMADMSAYIKGLDATHYVATGMISSHHTNLNPSDLYPYLPNVNIVTVHAYDGDRAATDDVQWAIANGKLALVEEIGYGGTLDRSNSYHQEIDYWKNMGAMGVMPWGFIAKGLPDTGNGDKQFGMDTVWHTDYDALVNVFQNYVAPGCNPNNLLMSTAPSSVKVGDSISFNLSGSEGSTFVDDSWSGGVACTGGFWGTKSCNASQTGNYTWTHSWKNCAINNCGITSTQCSKQLNYLISTTTTTSTPSAPTITTAGVCAPVAGYNGSGITISWTNPAGAPVVFADISPDSTFIPLYNKSVTGISTTSPSGFVLFGGTTPLTLSAGIQYFVRVYNGTHSDSSSFILPECASPTPTPTPTPLPVSLPGDIDGDGKVGIFDYNILVGNFGKTGSGIPADIDGNGKIDIFDYNILVGNFGKTG